MNRILFEKSEIDGDGRAVFGGERAAHVLDVLRGEKGQTLKTGVVDGPVGTSVIEDISAGGADGPVVTVKTRHDTESLRPWIDVILAPPRPRVLKRLLPQLAALGAGRIVLAGAQKVEKAFWGAQILKEENFRPLLVDGLMQAGTSVLPEIILKRRFFRWMNGAPDGGAEQFDALFGGCTERFVAHPYGGETVPSVPESERHPLLAIGPEGGWTDGEVESFEAHGFRRISLGPRILRTDTAAVALVARLGK